MADTRVHDDNHVAEPGFDSRRPHRRLPLGLRWLHIADFLTLQIVLAGSVLVRVWWDAGFNTKPVSEYVAGFIAATALHLVVYYFGGLYEPIKRMGARLWLPRTAALTLAAVLLDAPPPC